MSRDMMTSDEFDRYLKAAAREFVAICEDLDAEGGSFPIEEGTLGDQADEFLVDVCAHVVRRGLDDAADTLASHPYTALMLESARCVRARMELRRDLEAWDRGAGA